MAFEKEENNIFFVAFAITVLVIPLVATQNIDCMGKAFHCVNSTHFKICVDLGGGISTTVDDFVIPCPRSTVCKDSNYFECEYVSTTTLKPIQKSEVPNDTSVTPSLKNVDLATSFYENTSEMKLSEIVASTTQSSIFEFSEVTTDSALQIVTSDFSDSDKYSLQETAFIETSTTNEGLTSTSYIKVTLDNIEHNDKIKTNIDFKSLENTNSSELIKKNHKNPYNEELPIIKTTLDVFTNTSLIDSTTEIAQDSYNTKYHTNMATTENIITTINNKVMNPNLTSNKTNNLIEIENILITTDQSYNLTNVVTDKASYLKYSKEEMSGQKVTRAIAGEFGAKFTDLTIDLRNQNVSVVSTTGVDRNKTNNGFVMALSEISKVGKYTATNKNTFYDTTTIPNTTGAESHHNTEINDSYINYVQIGKNSTSTSDYKPTEGSKISYTIVDSSQNIDKSTLNIVKPFKNILSTDNLPITETSNVVSSTIFIPNVNFKPITNENITKDSMILENLNYTQNEKSFTNVPLLTNSFLKLDDKSNSEFAPQTYTVEPLPKLEEISSQPKQSATTLSIQDDTTESKPMTTDQPTTNENTYRTINLHKDDKRNDFVDTTMKSKSNHNFSFEINIDDVLFTRPMDINVGKNLETATVKSKLSSGVNVKDITTEVGITITNNDYDERKHATTEFLSTEKVTNNVGNYDGHKKNPEKLSTLAVNYVEIRESTVNFTEFSNDDTIVSLPTFINTTVNDIGAENNATNIEVDIQGVNYNNIFKTQYISETTNPNTITAQSDNLRINSSKDTVIEIEKEVVYSQTFNNFTVADVISTESHINIAGNTVVNIETLSTTTKVIDNTILSLPTFISTTVQDIASENNTTKIEAGIEKMKYNNITNLPCKNDIINCDTTTAQSSNITISSSIDTVETKNEVENIQIINNLNVADDKSTKPLLYFTGKSDVNIQILDTTIKVVDENINKNSSDIVKIVGENIKLPDMNVTTDNEINLPMYKIVNFKETSINLKPTDDTETLKSTNIVELDHKTDLNKSISNRTVDTNITIVTCNTTQDINGAHASDNNQIKIPGGAFNNSHLIVSDGESTDANKQLLSATTEVVDIDITNKTDLNMKLLKHANVTMMNSSNSQILHNINITEKNHIQIQPYIYNTKQMDVNYDGNNNGDIHMLNDSKIHTEVKYTTDFKMDKIVSTFSANGDIDIITEKNNNASWNTLNDKNVNDSDGINILIFDNSYVIDLKAATETIPNKPTLNKGNYETNNNTHIKVIEHMNVGENSEISKQTFNNTVLAENTINHNNNTTVIEENTVESIVMVTKIVPIDFFNNSNSTYVTDVTDAPIYSKNENKVTTIAKNNENLNFNTSKHNEKNMQISYNMEGKDIKSSKLTTLNVNVNESNYFNIQTFHYNNNTLKDNTTVSNKTNASTDTNIQNGINAEVKEIKLVGDMLQPDMNFCKEVNKSIQMDEDRKAKENSNKNLKFIDDKAVTHAYSPDIMNGSTNKNSKVDINDIKLTTTTVFFDMNINESMNNTLASNNISLRNNATQKTDIQAYNNTYLKSHENIVEDLQIQDYSESYVKKDKTPILSNTEIYNNESESNATLLNHFEANKTININEYSDSVDQIRITEILTLPQLNIVEVATKSDAIEIENTETNQNTQIEFQKTSKVSGEIKADNVFSANNDTASLIDLNITRVPLYSQMHSTNITEMNVSKSFNNSQDSNNSASNLTVNSKICFNGLILNNADNKISDSPKNILDIANDHNNVLKSNLKQDLIVQQKESINSDLLPSESKTISTTTNVISDILLSNQTTSNVIKDNANIENIPETLIYDFTTLPYEVKNKVTQPIKDKGIKIEEDKNIYGQMHTKEQIPATKPAHISTFTCINDGKYSDEHDCNKFYTCIGRHSPYIGRCPAGTVFSDIRKQCTKNLSHCIRNNQLKCLAEGRFIDVMSSEYYYICAKNKKGFVRFKLKCEKGYYLNRKAVHCLPREASFEDYSKNTSETRTRESTSSETIRNTNSFICVKEGKFEYPENCRKYYACSKKSSEFRRRIKQCESDEVFDVEKKKCVDEESYECRF